MSESDNRPAQLRETAARIKTLRLQLDSEMARRNQLMVELSDDGYSEGTVTKWAGLKSTSSVTHLKANPSHQTMILED